MAFEKQREILFSGGCGVLARLGDGGAWLRLFEDGRRRLSDCLSFAAAGGIEAFPS